MDSKKRENYGYCESFILPLRKKNILQAASDGFIDLMSFASFIAVES
jgi:hypothetical protein